MIRLIFTKRFLIILICFAAAGFYHVRTLFAQDTGTTSLLEYYNTTDRDTLDRSTEEMTGKLKGIFNKKKIEQTEAELDFSKYHTSFKNLFLYINKIAGYTDYEENIKFGRDKEIYKLLPLEGEIKPDKKAVVDEKYKRLEEITREEIFTCQEMIESSFDACELYTETLFWGEKFFSNPGSKETMMDFFESDLFRKYQEENRALVMKAYPEYVSRIDRLVFLWKEKPLKPTSPLIDPDIVENL